MQLRLSSGQGVYVAFSTTELALYFDKPDLALHFDLEGRLLKVSEQNQYRRRSLSHRVLLTEKLAREKGGGLARMVLPVEDANRLVAEMNGLTRRAWDELRDGKAEVEFAKPSEGEALERISPVLKRCAAFDGETAMRDAKRFHEIYGRVAVLPPDQYNALVLQVTEGCAYAGCLFCELYSNAPYRRKSAGQFGQHVREAVAYHGEGLRARRSIFLGEANALMLPQVELVEVFRVLNEHFELAPVENTKTPATWWMGHANRFDGVCSFMDVFKHSRRTVDDFRELQRLGLRRVYIGMESGDDALLKWLKKPATAESIAKYVGELKQANIAIGLIVLLGAGGQQFSDSHVRETSRLLNELKLDWRDYVYFSPLVIHASSRYAASMMANGTECLTDTQMRTQEQEIRARLRFDAECGRPYLAHYELETFLY